MQALTSNPRNHPTWHPIGDENWTNFFSLELFGRPRDPGKIPGYPAQKVWFPWFEGHTALFGPHPFTWKTPTPPENTRTQKFGFVLIFRAWILLLFPVWWPLQAPRRTAASEGCISSRKRRSFEVSGGGGIQEERGRWGGKKGGKKDAQKGSAVVYSVIVCSRIVCTLATPLQESPQQTKPKKGPKRKVHEFRPFLCEFWCLSLGKQARFTNWTFVPECPCEKFMNWPFFGLFCQGHSWPLFLLMLRLDNLRFEQCDASWKAAFAVLRTIELKKSLVKALHGGL